MSSKWYASIIAGALALACGSTVRAGDAAYTAAVLSSNPIAYWNFDEATGPALEQINGAVSAQMIAQGTATRGASTTTFGGASLGSAASFDGTAQSRFQAADVVPGGGPGAGFITSQRWAVEFWVNLGATTPSYISEMYSDAATNDPAFIAFFEPGLEMFAGGRTGGANVPFTANAWHHVVGAFYGNNSGFADNLREIYVDGALAYSDTTSSFSAGHGLNTLAIGNAVSPNDNAKPMLVDEYAIYELPGGGLVGDQLFVESVAAHYYVNGVPEPSTFALAAIAGAALVAGKLRSRRRRA
jgi:hypothetical protein